MKKFAFLFVVALLAMPMQAMAAGDQIGVYVAPKLIYGIETYRAKGYVTDGAQSFSESLGHHNEGVFGGALAVGYNFNTKFGIPVRTELEYSAFSTAKSTKSFGVDTDDYVTGKTKIDIQALFVNLYYDIETGTPFTPYVGGGIGMGFVGMKGSVDDYGTAEDSFSMGKKTQTNFAWNLGLGCAYQFNETFALDLGYRYADFGKGKSKGYSDENVGATSKVKANSVAMHQIMLGARVSF